MRILLLVFSTMIFSLLAGSCGTSEQQSVQIKGAWVREAPPNASAMAGYMTIVNNTRQAHTLVAADSDDFKVIEFHQSVEKDGSYRMVRHINLHLPANGTLVLKPGDFHLMMITPQRTLKEGDTIKIMLGFDDLPSVSLVIPVKKAVYE